ncbi:MAG: CCA tRNA nucleotidyltransferase [Desulfocucumaceae bacterium]
MALMVPEYVKSIMIRLEDGGFKSYLVGGAVRDILIHREPKDYDISTTATPREIRRLFKKVTSVGNKHGTVMVLMMEDPVEVNTLRSGPFFTTDLREDLSTRDFTLNAMAMDLDGSVYDYCNGLGDIRERIIRAVGDPGERFREDPLRMMRAIRFSVLLDFCIDQGTGDSMAEKSMLIDLVDNGRIRDELRKILLSGYPSYGIELLQSFNLLEHVIPGLTGPRHSKELFEESLRILNNTPENMVVRLAALLKNAGGCTAPGGVKGILGYFSGNGSKSAAKILKRLLFGRETIFRVEALLREVVSGCGQSGPSDIKKLIDRVGADNLDNLFSFLTAEIRSSAPPHDFSMIENMREEAGRILNEEGH